MKIAVFVVIYSVEQFTKKKFKNKNNFSVFHLNIASLQYHLEDLKILLSTLEHDFDIISISETKLKQNTPPTIDINIPDYHFEHTPSNANKGGTLIYISNKHNYKPRMDLKSQPFESKKIKSTFIEIINPKEKKQLLVLYINIIPYHKKISQT